MSIYLSDDDGKPVTPALEMKVVFLVILCVALANYGESVTFVANLLRAIGAF